jgi:hypothetical protein
MNIKELFPTIIENTKQFWEDLKVTPNGKNLLKKYPETLKHFPNELPQEAMYGLIGVVVGLLLILLGLGSLAPGLLLKIIISLVLVIALAHSIVSLMVYSEVMYSKQSSSWKDSNKKLAYIPVYGLIMYFVKAKNEL